MVWSGCSFKLKSLAGLLLGPFLKVLEREPRLILLGCGGGGYTDEQPVISPRVLAPVSDALLHCDVLGRRVVRDAQVGGVCGKIIERYCRVRFEPGDAEGLSIFSSCQIVDEGVGKGSEEAGLACSSGRDAELHWCCGIEVAVIGLLRQD